MANDPNKRTHQEVLVTIAYKDGKRVELAERLEHNHEFGEVVGIVSICRRALLGFGISSADIGQAFYAVANDTCGGQLFMSLGPAEEKV